jgi:hypothetical protein
MKVAGTRIGTPKRDEDDEYLDWCIDGLLGNLPARMPKGERAKAHRFALRQRKEHELRQAKITRLEKSLKPGEKPTEEQLKALGLVSENKLREMMGVPQSPLDGFIRARLNDDPSGDTDATLARALADLVRSDAPLDGDRPTRTLIADVIDGLLLSPGRRRQLARRSKLRAKITVIKELKHYLRTEGLTAEEANDAVVKSLDLGSVANMEKMIYRARRDYGIS